MNDNSPKQYDIGCLEDIHDLIIMNMKKEKQIMKLNIYLLKR